MSIHQPARRAFIYFSVGCGLLLLVGCQKAANNPAPPPAPPPSKPAVATIVTSQPSGIHFDSAYAGGIVTPNGDPDPVTQSGICVDTLPSPDITKWSYGGSLDSGAFQYVFAPLSPNTTYHARAFIRQLKGYTYGKDVTFTAASYPAPLGNYFFSGIIEGLATDTHGNLYAGGDFFATGVDSGWGTVSLWNGASWTRSTGLYSSQDVSCLYNGPTGTVYAASANYNDNIEWDISAYGGSSWNLVGSYNTSNARVTAICTDKNGNVYNIGAFTNAAGKYFVARYGPGGYAELGSFDQLPLTICCDSTGKLYVAGALNHGGNWGSFYIAVYDGATWSEMGLFNNVIFSICFDPAGNMIVAGAFTRDASGNIQNTQPGTNAGLPYYVAKWDGQHWSAIGDVGIIQNYGNNFTHVYSDAKGNLYAIGAFTDADGQYYILKWDGQAWSKLKSFNGQVLALGIDGSGTVYAGGSFHRAPGEYYVTRCN
jgi:hypothetical protein